MGVLDSYGNVRFTNLKEMAEIEKKCIEWRMRLKSKWKRLCQIHGDFHPGNIWFRSGNDFTVLDRSRGPWGDAADDITALTINYIFFSINYYGRIDKPYNKALRLFYDEYVKITGDEIQIEMAWQCRSRRILVHVRRRHRGITERGVDRGWITDCP